MRWKSRIVICAVCSTLAFSCGGETHHEAETVPPSSETVAGTTPATDTAAAVTDTATSPTTTGDYGDLTNLKNRTEAKVRAVADEAQKAREEAEAAINP